MKLKDYDQMIPNKIYLIGTSFLVKLDAGLFSMDSLGGAWSPVILNEYTEALWETEIIDTGGWLH